MAKTLGLAFRTGSGSASSFFPVRDSEVRFFDGTYVFSFASCDRCWQIPHCFFELLTFFNHERPGIPSSYRLIAHSFAILFIGSNLLQPYVDNDCILRLLACKVLLVAGFNSDVASMTRITDITPDVFFQTLCSNR